MAITPMVTPGKKSATLDPDCSLRSQYNAQVTVRVLAGEEGPRADLVAFNAGLRIYLAERASSIAEGLDPYRGQRVE
mgnify:CR=1 FL=1